MKKFVVIVAIIVCVVVIHSLIIPVDKLQYFYSWDTFTRSFNEVVFHIEDIPTYDDPPIVQ